MNSERKDGNEIQNYRLLKKPRSPLGYQTVIGILSYTKDGDLIHEGNILIPGTKFGSRESEFPTLYVHPVPSENEKHIPIINFNKIAKLADRKRRLVVVTTIFEDSTKPDYIQNILFTPYTHKGRPLQGNKYSFGRQKDIENFNK